MSAIFSETPPLSPGLYWQRNGDGDQNDQIIYLPVGDCYPEHWKKVRAKALEDATESAKRRLLRRPESEWKIVYSGPLGLSDARWQIVAKGELPPVIERQYEFEAENSIEVLALDKWGKMRVAVMDRWDSDDPLKWHTTCRDHLDIDGTIVAWMPLPNL